MHLCPTTLGERLLAAQTNAVEADLRAVVSTLADAAADLARGGPVAPATDTAAVLQHVCHDRVLQGLRQSPAGLFVSERLDAPLRLGGSAGLAVTLAPLAGVSCAPGALLAGCLFAVHALGSPDDVPGLSGASLRAAGLVVFGMPAVIAVTLGAAVDLYEFDGGRDEFLLARSGLRIPAGRRELAVDASNFRFWDSCVRHYVDACIAGVAGPQGADYALHWHGALAPELLRVLTRGGLYLAPDDARPGHDHGGHDFVCQALPAAFLVERAGGRAIDGFGPILARAATSPGSLVPLIFGSADAVARIEEYLLNDPTETTRYPLFETRGLIRS